MGTRVKAGWGMDRSLIIRMVGFALIPVLVCGLLCLAKRENEKEAGACAERIIIRPPKAMRLAAAVDMLFCMAVLILVTLFPHGTQSVPFTGADSPMVFLIFSLFSLLGACLLHAALVWRVEVFPDEDFFILRDCLGRRTRIRYADCTSYQYRHRGQEILVRNRVKDFTVGCFLINHEALIAAMQRYRVKREKDC